VVGQERKKESEEVWGQGEIDEKSGFRSQGGPRGKKNIENVEAAGFAGRKKGDEKGGPLLFLLSIAGGFLMTLFNNETCIKQRQEIRVMSTFAVTDLGFMGKKWSTQNTEWGSVRWTD